MTALNTLRRNLSLRDLVVYGLLFIGPLAPVAVFGVLDARADGAVALVYLLATLAMAFTAWSYAEMSRVVPHAGSVFAYASEGLGSRAGFLAGWLAMLDYLLIPSVAYLFSGIALHALVPAIPAWAFTVVAFAATTACNLAGVGVAARAGWVVLVAELVVFAAFVVSAVAVLVTVGPARPWTTPFTGVTTFSPSAVVGAISIAVLSYLGFDAIASFAEESAGDRREVGRAILFCLSVAGLLFVVQSYLAGVLSQVTPEGLAAHPERQGTAFYDITRAAIGPRLTTVLAATKAVGPAFAAMTGQAAAGRLLFGMARDGRLPRVLASVDPRHGVPRASLLVAATLTLIVSVWAARRDDGLDVLVSIVDVGALAAFTLLHASVVGYFVVKRRGPARVAHTLFPILGGAATLWVLVEASTPAKTVGLVWVAIGLVISSGWRKLPTGPIPERPPGRMAPPLHHSLTMTTSLTFLAPPTPTRSAIGRGRLRSIGRVAFWLALVACGGSRMVVAQERAAPTTPRWYKGNTHTHTLNSDGDSSPDEVVRWYREHGYRFLVLTDHNFLTDVRALNDLHGADEQFLVVKGEEVTDRFGDKPLHVNGLGVADFVPPQGGASVPDVLQRNVDAIRKVDGVPHINHPNFGWSITTDELRAVQHNRLFEIYNGHPLVNNVGGGGVPGLEEVWDAILSQGTLLYGIAVDDAHTFKQPGNPDVAGPGRGWVVIRAPRLEARALLDALERGEFYASTGVELLDYQVADRRMTVHVKAAPYAKYRVQFLGKGGRVLAEGLEPTASYSFRGDELYVRARVLSSDGRLAWCQPVMLPAKPPGQASGVAVLMVAMTVAGGLAWRWRGTPRDSSPSDLRASRRAYPPCRGEAGRGTRTCRPCSR